MIQGAMKDKNLSFEIVGVKDSEKFGKFLRKMEREGKIKEMSYSKFAAEYLPQESDNGEEN